MLKILAGGILGLLALTGSALAQSCSGATWTTLTNGNTADATQVMNNFTCVLSNPLFSGSVGIGVVPSQPLAVQALTNGNAIAIQGRPSDSASTLMFLSNAGAQQSFVQSNGDGSVNFGSNGGGLVTILRDGNVGIGTLNPVYTLQITAGSGSAQVDIQGSSSTLFSNYWGPNTGSTITASAGGGNCTYSGGSGWSCSSDERLKTDILDLRSDQGIAAINRLRPVSYRLDQNKSLGTQLGFLAQQVQQVFPQAVALDDKATSASTPGGSYLVNYTALIPPTVLAIQQLDARSRSEEAEINALRAVNSQQAEQLAAVKKELSALEKRISPKLAQN